MRSRKIKRLVPCKDQALPIMQDAFLELFFHEDQPLPNLKCDTFCAIAKLIPCECKKIRHKTKPQSLKLQQKLPPTINACGGRVGDSHATGQPSRSNCSDMANIFNSNNFALLISAYSYKPWNT